MFHEIQEILAKAGATVDETGKVLDLSSEGVRRAIKRGDIPATRIGPKTLRVPTSWLRTVLAVD
jgi:excisionase family DNA binding protein